MNKTFLLSLLILFSLSNFSIAQSANKFSNALAKKVNAVSTPEDLTVWIYFTDKGNNPDQKLAIAKQNLSQRTLDRRKRSLKNKPLVTFYDIPVAPNYLQQVNPFLTKLRHQSKWLNAVSAEVSVSQLEKIANLPFVEKIDIVRKGKRNETELYNNEITNTYNNTSAFYNLDYGGSLTQMEQMNVPFVHDLGFSGAGLLICVMDAGFRNISTHPAFATMDIMATYDFVNDDDNVDDEADDMGTGSHGTSTLSCVGGYDEGTLIGPAYGATYLLAKTENTDSETTVEEDNWVAAAEWAEGLGVDITSTSLGYVDFDNGDIYTPDELDGNTATITIAGDILASMGVLVVNSAGNSGNGVTTIGAPADGDEVLAIGAVTAAGNKSGFSSVGPTADGRIKPDVMAMGSAVLVANFGGGYNNSNGTSFSCPLAAGAAAVLWEMVPTATAADIRNALRATASNASTPNNQFGWGIINIYAAFEYLNDMVADTEAPVAGCTPLSLWLDGTTGTVSINPAIYGSALSADNVGIANFELDNNTFTCANVGENNITLTVTDFSGNEAECTAVVTIIDAVDPVATLATLPMVEAACEVLELPIPTASDICSGTIEGTTTTSFPITNQGTTTVVWTYDDGNGNTLTQNQMVVIADSGIPEPTMQTLPTVTEECEITNLPIPTADDNCVGNIAGVNDAVFPINAPGTTVVTWTYDDGHGNVLTQTQEVIINDVTNPVVLTQDITVDLNGNASIDITPSDIDAGSTDNCNNITTSLDLSTFSAVGVYTVNLTAVDGNNNTSTESAVVTVIDSSISSTDDLFASEFNLYPNPANENITLEFSNNNFTTVDINMYNFTGQLVKTITDYHSNDNIAVNDFPNGLYILKIEKENKSASLKLIIAK